MTNTENRADDAGAALLSDTTIVLIHGAWADGSSWAKVIPLLEQRGLQVIAVQNGLTSLAGDADAARRAIERAAGPVVLVGHSWGGAVITEAGDHPNVKALVYVAAAAPDRGQSLSDLTKGAPPPEWQSTLQVDSGGYLILPDSTVAKFFAQDLDPAEAYLVAKTQGPWKASCLEEPVTVAAWHDRPCWSVIPSDDRMIAPEAQELMAKAIGAKVSRTAASHVVMLSQPGVVADAIIEAAERTR